MSKESKKVIDLKAYKEKYIKENTLESMVYENGAAIGIVYRQIQLLENNIKQLKALLQDEKKV